MLVGLVAGPKRDPPIGTSELPRSAAPDPLV